jgi:hypothetical protein
MKQLITITILSIISLSANGQIGGIGFQSKEDYDKTKGIINAVGAASLSAKTSFDGNYTKINSSATLAISNNTVTETDIFYPTPDRFRAVASSYDNRFCSAETTVIKYSFSDFKNGVLSVFGVETTKSIKFTQSPYVGNKSTTLVQLLNPPTQFVEYFLETKKIAIQKVTNNIIIFNGIYYIKQ